MKKVVKTNQFIQNSDSDFLKLALEEAKKSLAKNEVPVGAIITKNNQIISRAHNLRETKKDTTKHAEIIAIKKACKKLNDWRLNDCVLYSTLEPCPMCAGAIIQARIKKVVYAQKDPKWGSAGTKINLFENNLFNHNVEIEYHETAEIKTLLPNFFKELRKKC